MKTTGLLTEFCCGINLGNSLDCFAEDGTAADETSWGNPRITRGFVRLAAESGFRILRVPVTWDGHFGRTGDCTVSPEWMNRVEEVARTALSSAGTICTTPRFSMKRRGTR